VWEGSPLRFGAQVQTPYFRKLPRLERDPEKAFPERDPGWAPIFGKARPGRDPGIMLKRQAKATSRFKFKVVSL
jgi:hypothetical protein